jgi:hypothetical protein
MFTITVFTYLLLAFVKDLKTHGIDDAMHCSVRQMAGHEYLQTAPLAVQAGVTVCR